MKANPTIAININKIILDNIFYFRLIDIMFQHNDKLTGSTSPLYSKGRVQALVRTIFVYRIAYILSYES